MRSIRYGLSFFVALGTGGLGACNPNTEVNRGALVAPTASAGQAEQKQADVGGGFLYVLTPHGVQKVWVDDEGNPVARATRQVHVDEPMVIAAHTRHSRGRALLTARSIEKGKAMARESGSHRGVPVILDGPITPKDAPALDEEARGSLAKLSATDRPGEIEALVAPRDGEPETVPAGPIVVQLQGPAVRAEEAAKMVAPAPRIVENEAGVPTWVTAERTELRRALRDHLADLSHCFDGEVRRNRSLRVRLHLAVGSDGVVEGRVDPRTPVDPTAERCVSRVASSWTIEAPHYGRLEAGYRVTARTELVLPATDQTTTRLASRNR